MEENRNSWVVREAFRQMREELGQPQSPGFEVLCEVTRGGVYWPHDLVVEVADMLHPRCLAHALSYRRTRAQRVWKLLRLSEGDLLIADRLARYWDADDRPRRAFAQHPAAGVRLWNQMQDTARSQELIGVVHREARRKGVHRLMDSH
ncbi:MAG: hypothetical protein JSW71_04625 [Gemmatimonadota bacterium]|nr:MAG: hypothetical protein JSW71_04625 [Gemmatimonadota bacterium]